MRPSWNWANCGPAIQPCRNNHHPQPYGVCAMTQPIQTAAKEEIIEKARLFLMWFDRDGTPVDGFRFQEQRKARSEAVGYREWSRETFGHRPLSKKVW